MISDDKRREIAAELRRQAAYSSGSLGEWWSRLQELVLGEVDFPKPKDVLEELAELIDRPTCELRDNPYSHGYRCTNCGQVYLDPRLYVVGSGYEEARYCPNCGAEVVSE